MLLDKYLFEDRPAFLIVRGRRVRPENPQQVLQDTEHRGALAGCLSIVSRMRRARVIRWEQGQTLIRFSTSVRSLASAVLMLQPPSAAPNMAASSILTPPLAITISLPKGSWV